MIIETAFQLPYLVLTYEMIYKMVRMGVVNVKQRLLEQPLDYRDKELHETLNNKALEKSFLL